MFSLHSIYLISIRHKQEIHHIMNNLDMFLSMFLQEERQNHYNWFRKDTENSYAISIWND